MQRARWGRREAANSMIRRVINHRFVKIGKTPGIQVGRQPLSGLPRQISGKSGGGIFAVRAVRLSSREAIQVELAELSVFPESSDDDSALPFVAEKSQLRTRLYIPNGN